MLKWLTNYKSAVFLAFCVLLAFNISNVKAGSTISYEILDTKVSVVDKSLTYTIAGNSVPVYKVSEKFSPFRVILDIANAGFAKGKMPSPAQIPLNNFAHLKINDFKSQKPPVVRFEFKVADSHDYSVEKKGSKLVLRFFPAQGGQATVKPTSSSGRLSLTDFKVSSTPNSTTISLVASGSVANYHVDTIGKSANKPPRMFIDIDDVAIDRLAREKFIGTSVSKVRVAPRGKGVRIVFDSASRRMFSYTVVPSKNGLDVVIDESKGKSLAKSKTNGGKKTASSDKTLDDLIDSSQKLLTKDPQTLAATTSKPSAAEEIENKFSLSGYKKKRISVDFYKIDVHNVFRLFRQITDLNIIVDEGVSGSLTLALNDVPWDFALDIILNLMDLKKEERFNTIVIYPADKDFNWPTREEDNLAFVADLEVLEKDTLIIENYDKQSKEEIQAKKIMAEAGILERKESYEEAVILYEKALKLWPKNTNLVNKISTLYLVNLGNNAKAVYFAKKALAMSPKNTHAALYAAIASANMQRVSEASDFFAQSVSTSPPMREALLSYAAFSENIGQNKAALKLLNRYKSVYGESLDTMVSKARLLDKLGLKKQARQEYRSLLTSGFQMRPDLKKYVKLRAK